MVLSGVPRKKSPVTPPGIDPGTVRLVAQRLNHYATPGPFRIMYTLYIVLRRIFWSKRDEVTGERRKLHEEELNDTQYCSGDQIEKDEMACTCSTYGGEQRFIQGFGRET